MVAAYFAGYGFWTERAWSRPVGNVVFGVLIIVSLLLAITSGNVLSAIGPALGAAAAAWYLNRPATKVQLYGAIAAGAPDPGEEPAGPVSLEASQPVR
jgi:O-antigen ligase